jgi:hypothetical protein
MLALNPSHRISAEEALNHEYFKEEPEMNNNDFLSLSNQETHDFVIKRHTLENHGNHHNQNNAENHNMQYIGKQVYDNHSSQKVQSLLGNKKERENN